MNPKVNHVLKEVRKIVEQAAWGPEIPSRSSDFQSGAPGVGQATSNASDIQDSLDFYLENVSMALVDEFNITPEDAYDRVENAADEVEGEGMLPPLPGPNDGDEQAAMWLGAAKSMGFEGYCIKMVRDELSAKQSLRAQDAENDADGSDYDADNFDDMDDADMGDQY